MTVRDLAEVVDKALDEGRFSEAMDLLADDARTDTSPELQERRAVAAYGAGDFEETIRCWERVHGLCRDADDSPAAARAAAMVAMFLMIDTGLMAPVRGWLGRAEDLLAGTEGDPVGAILSAVRTYERFMCGDLDRAGELASEAIELGRRFGDRNAEVIGRTAAARVAILSGDVDGGLERLDDVGALLMSGEVDPLTTGMMLCELVCAAQGLSKYDMATEWTEAMDRWGSVSAFGGLGGRCRVHKAELLRVSGPADAAEAEALQACDDLRPWMRREFGWPLAELGNVRLRKGDLAGAEEAFVAAHEHVWCPHPGLARVRLAQGRPQEARELIDEAIAHPFRTPSKERPPFVDLTLAPLYEASAEIAAALGDATAADAAATSLRDIAGQWPSQWLEASADLAEARARLCAADHGAASRLASEAAASWSAQGAPYESACARLVLAAAHAACHKDAAAEMERRAALAAFEEFGAERAAAEARALLDAAADTGSGTTGSEGRAQRSPTGAGFTLSGDMRTISFDGTTATLSDLKGFRYLERLFAEPGREFHVLDLVAVEQGTLPTGPVGVVGPAELDSRGGSGLPALDDTAREAYRQRLAEVEADIEEARRCNDPARQELAENDRDYLVAELSRAVGLGGRLRSVGGDSERARTAVARTLRYATERIAEHNPALAAHLRNTLHTGTYCSYRPDTLTEVSWDLGTP